MLFSLVKDFFKWIEGLGRSVTVRVQSDRKRFFDPGGIRKKYSIHCQISRWKTRYIVFQRKVLFSLVKDLFKWIERLGRSVTVRVQSDRKRFFDPGGIRKKYSIHCQISRWKTRYIVFQRKVLFSLVKDFFKWIEGLGRSVTVRVQSDRKRFFDPGGIRKKYSIHCQISRWKTRYIVFQRKVLFSLVKDFFKWIEGLGRSVTVRVQSDRKRFFDPGGIRKKYSIHCQISRWKTRYIVFQRKVLFSLVKDFFKWIEGVGRSVTVRVQSDRKRFFDPGGIRKK